MNWINEVKSTRGCKEHLKEDQVSRFEKSLLGDILAVKILDHLFKIGEIDRLYAMTKESLDIRADVRRLPPPVHAVLRRANITDVDSRLSAPFLELIRTRNTAFRSKLHFLLLSIADFVNFGESLLWKPEIFMARSQIFDFFDYAAGFDLTESGHAKTALWCQYVSALTNDESEQILSIMEQIGLVRDNISILECGGNMGTFARKFVKRFSCKSYTVLDIPNVCALGAQHNETCDLAVEYIAADMFDHNLKIGQNNAPDLIIFKSVLHDWPRERLRVLLENAIRAVPSDGAVCIVERGPFRENSIGAPNLGDVCNIVFSPFYRDPGVYKEIIEDIDEEIDVSIEYFWIEMEWFVLSARRRK